MIGGNLFLCTFCFYFKNYIFIPQNVFLLEILKVAFGCLDLVAEVLGTVSVSVE